MRPQPGELLEDLLAPLRGACESPTSAIVRLPAGPPGTPAARFLRKL